MTVGWLSALRDGLQPRRISAPSSPEPRTTRPAALSVGDTRWQMLEAYGRGGPDVPVYSFALAMAAPGFCPWLRVGAERLASNLAGLPLLRADTGEPFTAAGTRDRAMWWVSYALCDECWAIDGAYLHPARGWVRDGEAVGYVDDSGTHRGAPVEWHRGLTFSGGPNNRGTSAVKSLQSVLNTEFHVDRHSARAAKRGQVSALLTPASSSITMGPELREQIEDDWQARREEGIDLYVLPQDLKVTPMELSARDQEFSTVVQRAQSAALAAMGVPPTMAGLPGANYGTAREESRGFWLRAINLCGGHDPFSGMNGFLSAVYGVPLRHDFSSVPALRSTYADMAKTAQTFVALGMSSPDAMAAAGLPPDVARLATGEPQRPAGRPPEPAQADEPRERLASVLRASALRHASGAVDLEREAIILAGALAELGADPDLAEAIVRDQAAAAELAEDPTRIGAFSVSWVESRCL